MRTTSGTKSAQLSFPHMITHGYPLDQHGRHGAGSDELVVAEKPAVVAPGELRGEQEQVGYRPDVPLVSVVADRHPRLGGRDDLRRAVTRVVVGHDQLDRVACAEHLRL